VHSCESLRDVDSRHEATRYTNIESTCEADSAREQKHHPDAARTHAHLLPLQLS
jgi:hypothetical protein